jgi:quinol monooxygenase YgiN
VAKQAIVVTYRVKPGRMDELMRRLSAHVAKTLADELGCLQFDILRPHGRPDEVRLYEVYADEAAVAAHNRSEQLARYKAATADLLDERVIVACRIEESA